MTTALAGIGPDRTQVSLVADPSATTNRHEITARGRFGSLHVVIDNAPLPANPKSSAMAALGLEFDHTAAPLDAWVTVMLMEVWHWTPLVALLAYAGLRAIPDAYYQAARIDGASPWAVFRYIQLPKMRGVLTIAILLRFMDSFLIYAEPFVLTGGGPGNATTFLSIYLVKLSTAMDLGPAAAFSIIYFLIILLFCWLFYQALQNVGTGDKA